MGFKNSAGLEVEWAIIDDILRHEGGELVADEDDIVIVRSHAGVKCVPRDERAFLSRRDMLGKDVSVMNMPIDGARLGITTPPCKSYAYLLPMPPALKGDVEIRRLAGTLADTVYSDYRAEWMTADDMRTLMAEKGVFGALVGGALAGFIGRHDDGSMGMLHIYDRFRRRGIGEELERFLINYIMTFGRVPHCDVYEDNAPSHALQNKLGLTAARGYTYWPE